MWTGHFLFFLYHVSMLLMTSFQDLLASCPTSSEVSCCKCVSTPGCSWYSPPEAAAYCASSPFLSSDRTSLPDWAQGGSNVTPTESSVVMILANEPHHMTRGRFLRPQRARVSLAVGMRFQFGVQMAARSTRTRIVVRGPTRENTGQLEFGLRPADDDSCANGLREQGNRISRHREASTGRPRGTASRRRRQAATSVPSAQPGRRFPRRRVFTCRGDGPGQVHNLLLELDVKRCLDTPLLVRVIMRVNGVRSQTRVRVDSMCQCPTCSSSPASDGADDAELETTSSCQGNNNNVRCRPANLTQTLSSEVSLCSQRGLNDACVLEDGPMHGRVCSGHGLCLCGQCVCSARHELYPAQRYSGHHCECDDYSCGHYQGALCGGPERGVCTCGTCVCREGYTGTSCQVSDNIDICIQPNPGGNDDAQDEHGVSAAVCGGRGQCVHGQCECSWPYTGQFCECDNQACPSHHGALCGGNRGHCICGSCVCEPGYSGPACQYGSASPDGNQPPATCLHLDQDTSWPLVCSGRGVCIDGQCACPTPYTGSLCEDCPSCGTSLD
ncbi:integrin, beta-like 1 [Plakobranchus ocellatus]|uniref:Integrin, beta-like 1 n=1 Tax=Plakobranchus ocellatus TaxID=259542 RepID=A0AAV3Y1R8_9GAST|nr:integrin, beta-like 1 [Plakobranchus ocellatus]